MRMMIFVFLDIIFSGEAKRIKIVKKVVIEFRDITHLRSVMILGTYGLRYAPSGLIYLP